MEKTIEQVQKRYNLEFEKAISGIKKKKAKLVLLQFPDGLKPYATIIVDYLKEKLKNVKFLIWFGSCYGACDLPVLPKNIEKQVDLIIQFGHSEMMPSYKF